MDKNKLKEFSTEELQKKEKSTKTLMGLFVPIILALAYFSIRDYIQAGELDSIDFLMIICPIGGLVALFPQLKAIQEELSSR